MKWRQRLVNWRFDICWKAGTKIPNTCTVCHHLMQQVTSRSVWDGESPRFSTHTPFFFFLFFFQSISKKEKETQREETERAEAFQRREGNASLSLCQVPVLLFRGQWVQINTLAPACFCKMRVGGAAAMPAASDKYSPKPVGMDEWWPAVGRLTGMIPRFHWDTNQCAETCSLSLHLSVVGCWRKPLLY